MIDDRTTLEGTLAGSRAEAPGAPGAHDAGEVTALIVAWSRKEPDRIGEAVLVDGPQILGRGDARPDDPAPRARFVRQRPGLDAPADPLGSPRVSRVQLRLSPVGDRIEIESIGVCPMLLNGAPARRGEVGPGDTVHVENELLFVVTRRPAVLPSPRTTRYGAFAFGEPDPFGYVGESPAAWRMRDLVAFAAAAPGHVLITGESGVGKELVAGAVHQLSPRGARPLVARNAATFPEGIVDAELFGNARNYPNPGTPERAGVIGEADGTSLFLDEIGELPERLQAHLLRVLDRRGEYHRLGESRVRRADLRVIAATNRALEELKHDLAARFTLRIAVPSLSSRREDVPLLIRQLLRRAARGNEQVRQAFFEPAAGGEPAARLAPDLVERLVRHDYRLHTRELEQILWQALTESRGPRVELTDGVARRLAATPAPEPPPPPPASKRPAPRAPVEIDRSRVEQTLARTRGNVTRAARELGLPNRYALYRLMRKLDMRTGQPESGVHGAEDAATAGEASGTPAANAGTRTRSARGRGRA